MRLITCPEVFERKTTQETAIFLAGGISGCANWQKEFIARFKDLDDNFILINPRRDSFDITNPDESTFQIEWEFKHLHAIMPEAVVFWFPHETLCPITLYELGMQMGDHSWSQPDVFIGCHPGYARKFDVEKQVSLVKSYVNIHSNFEDLVSEIKEWYAN